jgi:hypothetical protein
VGFTVHARLSARRFTYHRISLLSALEQSLSLEASGMADVHIINENGCRRTAAEVYELLFGPRSATKQIDDQSGRAVRAVAA